MISSVAEIAARPENPALLAQLGLRLQESVGLLAGPLGLKAFNALVHFVTSELKTWPYFNQDPSELGG